MSESCGGDIEQALQKLDDATNDAIRGNTVVAWSKVREARNQIAEIHGLPTKLQERQTGEER